MTGHFYQRVMERIGTVDPLHLWQGLEWAIAEGRTDLVKYEGRIDRNGLRAWRFRVPPDGKEFIALVDTNNGQPVTVLHPAWLARKMP